MSASLKPAALKQFVFGYPGATLVAAAYWLIAVSATLEKCTTFDEMPHLTAGYSYWKTGDYRLHPENGNLPQRWGALPLCWTQPAFPSTQSDPWRASDMWTIGYEFFYRMDHDVDAMLLQARATMAFWGFAAALLVYAWSRSLFGPVGGFISLVCCVSCPTMLAHGPLVTSDVVVAFFFLAAAGTWWRLLHHLSPGRFLCCSLALSGLFLAKFSAVLFVPMGFLMVLVRLWGPPPTWEIHNHSGLIASRRRQLAMFFLAGLAQVLIVALALWAAYGFRYAAFAESDGGDQLYPAGWEWIMEHSGTTGRLIQRARDAHLLPEAYLFGFAHTLRFSHARPSFFNGELGDSGWFWFFPQAFLVKTPIPLLVICVVALAAPFWRAWRSEPSSAFPWAAIGESLYAVAPLWLLIAVYSCFALTSNLNIGHRHLLPIYPALYILVGAAAYWLAPHRAGTPEEPPPSSAATRGMSRVPYRLGAVATVLALALMIAESWTTYPHYLAYFNQFVGGPSFGYRHYVDSSLDWGQDLPGLKKWLDANGEPGTPTYLTYFGSGSPTHYGIQAKLLPAFTHGMNHWPPQQITGRDPGPLKPGIYCISATMLQGVYLPDPVKGPWTAMHETAYVMALKMVAEYDALSADPKKRAALDQDRDRWQQFFFEYDLLRFERLCTYLRDRNPDDNIGHSILIYRVNNAELDRALRDPRMPDYDNRSP